VFGTDMPVHEHRSLNGLLLESFGRVPAARESMEVDGITIEVLDSSDTQVLRVRLTRLLESTDG